MEEIVEGFSKKCSSPNWKLWLFFLHVIFGVQHNGVVGISDLCSDPRLVDLIPLEIFDRHMNERRTNHYSFKFNSSLLFNSFPFYILLKNDLGYP